MSNLCQVDYLKVAQYLQKKGIEVRIWDESFCNVGSGALYAYDTDSLQALLNKNSQTLIEAHWPTQVDPFVICVATVTALFPSRLYEVVAEAFADDELVQYSQNTRMGQEACYAPPLEDVLV